MYIALLLTLICCSSAVIVTAPINKTVVVGSTVSFNCSSNNTNSIYWRHRPNSTNTFIVSNKASVVTATYKSRVEVTTDSTNRTSVLTIQSTQWTDAGFYVCSDDRKPNYSALLTLMDANCASSSRVVGANVEIVCLVNYSSYPKTSINCLPTDNSIHFNITSENVTDGVNSATYRQTLVLTSTWHAEVVFSCKTSHDGLVIWTSPPLKLKGLVAATTTHHGVVWCGVTIGCFTVATAGLVLYLMRRRQAAWLSKKPDVIPIASAVEYAEIPSRGSNHSAYDEITSVNDQPSVPPVPEKLYLTPRNEAQCSLVYAEIQASRPNVPDVRQHASRGPAVYGRISHVLSGNTEHPA